MRALQLLCIIVFAGLVLARPQVNNKSHRPFGYKYIRSGGGGKHPLSPLSVLRNQYGLSKTVTKILPREKICQLCPPVKDIQPCMCKCYCNTTTCLADIKCEGPTLQEASELEKILSLTTYPVKNYSSLLVESTLLNGAITKFMLGSTVSFNEINIHHNGFNYIDKHAFNYTGHILKKLLLNNNQIQMLDWCLKDMPHLKYMDISYNRLTFIPGDALHSQQLKVLNFSHNDLGDVGTEAFAGLTKLESLDLSHNAIENLGYKSLAFNLLDDVHLRVNLSHNQINTIGSTAFKGAKLIHIDLKWNRLDSLDENVFRNFIESTDGSIHFDVAGNPIACDCKLKWIVQNSTVSRCFDDFPVCDSTLSLVTTENLGDCSFI